MDDSQLRIIIEAQNRASATLAKIQKDVERLSSGVERSVGKTSGIMSKAANGLDNFADKIAGLVRTAAALTAGGALGSKYFIDLAGSLQMTQRQIAVLTGGVDEANRVFGELYNYTLGKPIAFPDASRAAKTLLGYGRTTQTVVKDMDTLSRMSIVNGADLQHLSVVFGQITSRGALFGQDALQLINNNIPLTTILARHFGVSMEEASKRINGGTVSAAEFVKAMEGYAGSLDIKSMTDTFQNRMISLQGTIRSTGLAILGITIDPVKGFVVEAGGLFDQLSNRVVELTNWLRDNKDMIVSVSKVIIANIVPALKVLATAFIVAKTAAIGLKTAMAIGDIARGFKNISAVAKEGATIFTVFGAAGKVAVTGMSTAFGILKTVGTVALVGIKAGLAGVGAALGAIPVVGWIAIAVAAISGLMVWLYKTNDGFRNFVNGIFSAIGGTLGKIGSTIISIAGTIASTVSSVFKSVLGAIGSVFSTIFTIISSVAGFITSVVTTIIGVLTPLWQIIDLIVSVIVGLGQIVFTVFTGIGQVIFTIVSTIVQIIGVVFYGTIMAVWNNVIIPFGQAVGAIFVALGQAIGVAMATIQSVVTTVWNAIVSAVTPIVQGLASTISSIIGGITAFVGAAIGAMAATVGAILNGLAGVVNAVMGVVRQYIITPISQAVSYVAGTVGQIATHVRNAVQGAYNAVTGFVGNFVNAGKDMIDGIVKGVMNAKDAVVNKIKEICSGALDAVKSFFGIKSPSRVMAEMGVFMMQGWRNGLDKLRGRVVDKAREISQSVKDQFDGDIPMGDISGLRYNGGMTGAAAMYAAGSTTVHNSGGNRNTTNQFNGQIVISTPEAADAFFKRLDRDGELASKGVPT